jgi:DNA adenine methylase
MNAAPSAYGTYIEPFAGSACLFFALNPDSAILGDFNPHLVDAYQTIARHPRLVARTAYAIPNTSTSYYALRRCAPASMSAVPRAARFLYLNRYCFNGVYRTNRAGQFNVPRGTSTGEIPSERDLYRASLALRRARLVAGDFDVTLRQARQGDFVYLDPPYATADRPCYGEYGYGTFASADMGRLLGVLADLDARRVRFMMSYADRGAVRSATSQWHHRYILVRRHVAGFNQHRALVRELLISNYV